LVVALEFLDICTTYLKQSPNLIQFEKFQVDSVEIKENVCAFAWEPVGSKFAIIHGESQSMNVSFYSVTTGNDIFLPIDYKSTAGSFLVC
jgi:uncharacterized protein with WD repeat